MKEKNEKKKKKKINKETKIYVSDFNTINENLINYFN